MLPSMGKLGVRQKIIKLWPSPYGYHGSIRKISVPLANLNLKISPFPVFLRVFK